MSADAAPAGAGAHARRILGLAAGVFFLVVGVWLFVGDAMVLAHQRPQYGDGPFGVMVGPIVALLGAYMAWQNLAAYGLVRTIRIKRG